jgi:anti-sigma B factor antagonist
MPLADLNVEMVGQLVVARLDGEIDMSNAGELGEALGRQVSNEALGLILDLTDVHYLDSAGIQVIYELREQLETRGQEIALVVASESPIDSTLRVAGVASVLGIAETLDEAISNTGA